MFEGFKDSSMPGCKPGPNICKEPIKAEFTKGRKKREKLERGQLHDGCFCKLIPCDQFAPIQPIRCLKN